MVRRTVTAVLLLAVLLPAIFAGGIAYFVLVAAFVCIAAWEYVLMFRIKAYDPAAALVLAAVLFILGARAFWPETAGALLALCILVAMGFHLLRFERGRDQAALDLVIGLGAVTYLGWVAAYLIDLRSLPHGAWWLLLVFVIVWISDAVAYFVGVRYGEHKMFTRLSPKKSWEGYFGGVVAGTLAAGVLAALLNRFSPLQVGIWTTLGLGFMLSTLTTLGDLGESLFKRFAGVKDSGSLLPGHGGAFDRIDSLIWAGVLGYFWISQLML
jgi:phosphatidate cytidylyltransferase